MLKCRVHVDQAVASTEAESLKTARVFETACTHVTTYVRCESFGSCCNSSFASAVVAGFKVALCMFGCFHVSLSKCLCLTSVVDTPGACIATIRRSVHCCVTDMSRNKGI